MAKDAIQLQRALGLQGFLENYGSEEQLQQALRRLRQPWGLVHPASGDTTGCVLLSRGIRQCRRCQHQTSVIAESIFHRTKPTLTQWILAIFLSTQQRQGVSALQFSFDLGIKNDTVWRMKHKPMQVMCECLASIALPHTAVSQRPLSLVERRRQSGSR